MSRPRLLLGGAGRAELDLGQRRGAETDPERISGDAVSQ